MTSTPVRPIKRHPGDVDPCGMGEIVLAYEDRGTQHLVFALQPPSYVLWGMDCDTHEEWWYTPDPDPGLREAIALALMPPPVPFGGGLGAPHVEAHASAATLLMDAVPVGTGLDPGLHPGGSPPGPRTDLALQQPGHALLAVIEARYQAAAVPQPDGMPGVLDDDIGAWCLGYVGEERVGRELAGLPADWRVLNSVPVGERGSDIDHVVIGPAGVLTLNTKHHADSRVEVRGDAVYVNGHHQHYVRNARHEASRAQAIANQAQVPVAVAPLVVTVGARLKVKEPPADVVVLSSDDVRAWLLAQPPRLSRAQVDALFETMRWSTAWTTAPPVPEPSPWVAGFAHSMALEAAGAAAGVDVASGDITPAADAATGFRLPAWSRPLGALVAAVVVLIAALTVGKPLMGAVLGGIRDAVVRPTPAPTAPAAPGPRVRTAGARCTTSGATAHDAVGHALVCKRAPTGGLTWHRTV